MANPKAQIYSVPISGEQATINLNTYRADIKPFSSFNEKNCPYYGGTLSPLWYKDTSIEENVADTMVSKSGDVYDIKYDPDTQAAYFRKNGENVKSLRYNKIVKTEINIDNVYDYYNDDFYITETGGVFTVHIGTGDTTKTIDIGAPESCKTYLFKHESNYAAIVNNVYVFYNSSLTDPITITVNTSTTSTTFENAEFYSTSIAYNSSMNKIIYSSYNNFAFVDMTATTPTITEVKSAPEYNGSNPTDDKTFFWLLHTGNIIGVGYCAKDAVNHVTYSAFTNITIDDSILISGTKCLKIGTASISTLQYTSGSGDNPFVVGTTGTFNGFTTKGQISAWSPYFTIFGEPNAPTLVSPYYYKHYIAACVLSEDKFGMFDYFTKSDDGDSIDYPFGYCTEKELSKGSQIVDEQSYATIHGYWRILMNQGMIQNVSFTADTKNRGTVVEQWNEIDATKNLYINTDGDVVYYLATSKKWVKVSVEIGSDLVLIADRYIQINTTSQENIYDTETGDFSQIGDDWNNRMEPNFVPIGGTVDKYTVHFQFKVVMSSDYNFFGIGYKPYYADYYVWTAEPNGLPVACWCEKAYLPPFTKGPVHAHDNSRYHTGSFEASCWVGNTNVANKTYDVGSAWWSGFVMASITKWNPLVWIGAQAVYSLVEKYYEEDGWTYVDANFYQKHQDLFAISTENFSSVLYAMDTFLMGSAVNANYEETEKPFASTIFNPIICYAPKTRNQYQSPVEPQWKCNKPHIVDGYRGLQPVDVYIGSSNAEYVWSATNLDYTASTDPSKVDGNCVVRNELLDETYPITTDGNIYYNVPILFDYLPSATSQDMVKINNTAYSFVYANESQLIFLYQLNSAFYGIDNAFIVQGQNYAVANNRLVQYTVSNGAVADSTTLLSLQGLDYIAATPYQAIFWSKSNHTFYAFTGDKIMNPLLQASSVNTVSSYSKYNPATGSVLIPTDIGFFVIADNGMFKIKDLEEIKVNGDDKHEIFITDTGITMVTDNHIYALSYNQLDGYSDLKIKLETEFYGVGNNVISVNDTLYLRLFVDEPVDGTVKLSVTTLTTLGMSTEDKIIKIKASDWDKLTNTYYLRYQPKLQRSIGASYKIESNFKIGYIGIGSTPETVQVAKNNF